MFMRLSDLTFCSQGDKALQGHWQQSNCSHEFEDDNMASREILLPLDIGIISASEVLP